MAAGRSGGLDVEGRSRAVEQPGPPAVGGGADRGLPGDGAASDRDRAVELSPPRPGDVGHGVEQVLLPEPARVQVLEVKVLELGAETFPQVGLGPLRDPAQVTQRTAGLRGDLRQLVRPEDDKRDYREEKQLGQRKVKHSALRRGRSALMTTLNRKGAGVDSLRPGSPFS